MLEQVESELAELVVREQRGFRRIVFAGMAILLVLVLISTTLGVYYFLVSRNLGEMSLSLQRQAFDTRRLLDTQTNRISDQEAAMRAAYSDIRLTMGASSGKLSDKQRDAAREAAVAYVQRGRRISLAEERVLKTFAGQETPVGAFSNGVLGLLEWQTSGATFPESDELPPQLQAAIGAFELSAADKKLAAPAQAGIAWAQFLGAQARDWDPEACDAVFKAVEAATSAGGPAPQPLYLQAQCERKIGRTADSLVHYTQALHAAAGQDGTGDDDSELIVAMNAFHGVGTTLIAGAALPDDAPGLKDALEAATRLCGAQAGESGGATRMHMATACLRSAMDLRGRIRQSPNQISGSRENVSFALLREGDYAGAFRNTEDVERTGLFAWNELVRAMTAEELQAGGDADLRRAAAAALPEARRNVSFFTPAQFAVCELEALLSPEDFEKAVTLLRETHKNAEIGCAR